jgi:hypothetical protein
MLPGLSWSDVFSAAEHVLTWMELHGTSLGGVTFKGFSRAAQDASALLLATLTAIRARNRNRSHQHITLIGRRLIVMCGHPHSA